MPLIVVTAHDSPRLFGVGRDAGARSVDVVAHPGLLVDEEGQPAEARHRRHPRLDDLVVGRARLVPLS